MSGDAQQWPMTGNPLDASLQLVADRRRRQVIRELRQDPTNSATLDELVDRLFEAEPVAADPATDRERLAIQLYHSHLPKLADHGVVEYDRQRGTVQYVPDDQIETVLDSLPDTVPAAKP